MAFRPARPNNSHDQRAARLAAWWFNHRFLVMTRGAHDFVGVNYYFSSYKQWQWRPPFITTIPTTEPTSDLGWPIDPTGLTQVLLELKRYKLPIYITENGVADAADTKRADFIRDHLRAVERAQAAGADVRGYLHWSLIDNFEWDLGFAPRFGLVAVDYATQKRTPRRSAYVYKAIIEQANRQ
jgi:beta-glucosidase